MPEIDELQQARNYIITLKLQMGDLYSRWKESEAIIGDLQQEISKLKGQNEPQIIAE